MIVGFAEYGWDERIRWCTKLLHWTTWGRYDPWRCHWQPCLWTKSGKFWWKLVTNHMSSCIMNVCFSKEMEHSEIVSVLFIVWSDFVLQAEKNAFVVADLGALMRQHVLWKTTMPQVRPFYPVCCNSSPVVIEVLSALGVGFVCANKVTFYLFIF